MRLSSVARAPVAAWVVAVLAAGCGLGDLVHTEAVVVFEEGATAADHRRVHDACSGIPNVVAQPMEPGRTRASRLRDVRFDVTKANEAQRSQLYGCLDKDPSVKGVEQQGD